MSVFVTSANFNILTRRTAGHWEIWKQPVSGGRAIQITRKGGYMSRESSDGNWLYFTREGGDSIWRMPSLTPGGDSAAAELVIGPPYNVQTEGWTLTRDEIVFIDRPTQTQPAAIRAYSLATRQVRLIMNLKEVFLDRGDIGVSISPVHVGGLRGPRRRSF